VENGWEREWGGQWVSHWSNSRHCGSCGRDGEPEAYSGEIWEVKEVLLRSLVDYKWSQIPWEPVSPPLDSRWALWPPWPILCGRNDTLPAGWAHFIYCHLKHLLWWKPAPCSKSDCMKIALLKESRAVWRDHEESKTVWGKAKTQCSTIQRKRGAILDVGSPTPDGSLTWAILLSPSLIPYPPNP
jgi:hypothetical protein